MNLRMKDVRVRICNPVVNAGYGFDKPRTFMHDGITTWLLSKP